jgi:hypothetical protein
MTEIRRPKPTGLSGESRDPQRQAGETVAGPDRSQREETGLLGASLAVTPATRLALKVAWVGIAGLGLWFGLFARLSLPIASFMGLRADHLEHIACFGGLGFLALCLYRPAALVALALVVAAGLLEIAQILSPVHESHFSDWLVSSLGLLAGLVLFYLLRGLIALGQRRQA